MLVVLDSTVLIDHLRGRPVSERLAELHGRGETLATTAINVEEIHRGIRLGEEAAVRDLFDGLLVLPVARDVAALAGEWRRDYAMRGVTLWQADCLVAATVHTADGTLATGNPKDFPMPELRVEHWPVGA